MPSAAEIMNMTPEQVEAVNKKLAKRFVIRVAVTMIVTAGTLIAVDAIAAKFIDNNDEDAEN